MSIKIAVFATVAAAAVAIGTPTALGEGRLAGASHPADAVAYFRANELATAASANTVDAVAYFRRNELVTAVARNGTSALSSYSAAEERPTPTTASNPATTIDAGRSVQWLQFGLGVGLGVALMLGILLGLRFVRPGVVAH